MTRSVFLALIVGTLASLAGLISFLGREKVQARQRKLDENLVRAQAAAAKKLAFAEVTEALPQIQVEQERIDLGTISHGTQARAKFVLRNRGTGPLLLRPDKSSCACFQAEFDEVRIAPGDESQVQATLNTYLAKSERQFAMSVVTNDPARQKITLKVVADIKEVIAFEPETLFFNDLRPREERTLSVKLLSRCEEPVTLEAVHVSPRILKVSHCPLEASELESAKGGFAFNVTCPETTDGLLEGELVCRVRKVGAAEAETFRVPIGGKRLRLACVYGEPLNEFGEIHLGNLAYGVERRWSYAVKMRGKNKQPGVRQIRVVPDFVKVFCEPTETAETTGLHTLTILVPSDAPEGSFQGDFRGSLEIEFADEEYEPLRLELELAVTKE